MDPTLVDACGDKPGWPCDQVFRATNNKTLAKGADFLVGTPLKILFIVIGAFVLNRLVHRAIRRFTAAVAARATAALLSGLGDGARTAARTQTLAVVLTSLTSAIIYGFAALIILGEVGINLGPLIAGAGIAGVAIGFGAQSLVKDFLTGIFMLVEDQYGVGDVVDLGEAVGTVEAVNLRSTRLRAADGTVWYVPNGQIARVGNKSQQWSRALIDVEVAYDTDLRLAEDIIKQTADGLYADPDWQRELLEEPEVWGVERIGSGGVDIRLVIKTRPASQFKVMRELRIRVKEALDERGIQAPTPVVTPSAPPR
ncbi:MAG: moderate conductance mechanosensitive channel [Acidimicrobiaceae bacterium]|jgi:small conductance mechanosensitive channel